MLHISPLPFLFSFTTNTGVLLGGCPDRCHQTIRLSSQRRRPFAQVGGGCFDVLSIATFPHRLGQASEFATARFTLIALPPIRSVVPSFPVLIFDLTHRSLSFRIVCPTIAFTRAGSSSRQPASGATRC
jgi:hypothetical protein